MVTPFDPSQLANVSGRYRADAGAAGFNAADFIPVDSAHPKYRSASGAFLNGLTKLSLGGFVYFTNQSPDSAPFVLASQQSFPSNQMCFSLSRNGTPGNALRVSVAASLSDTGANYATGTADLGVAVPSNTGTSAGPGTCWHAGFDFDGTQPTNATRLRLRVNGVTDPATFTGTIPASLTSSAAGLLLGYGAWDGSPLTGLLWDWFAVTGANLTDAQWLALANVGRSGFPLPYGWASLPAGAPAQATFARFWQLSEASNASAPVTRLDSTANAGNLTDGLGAGGNVASASLSSWADQTGNGNHALGVPHWGPNSTWVWASPALQAAQTPSGKAAWLFPANTTQCCFNCGKLGRSANPSYGATHFVFKPTALPAAGLVQLHGSEQSGGRDGNNSSTHVWMYGEVGDFTQKPSCWVTAAGNGLGDNSGTNPGKNAARGHVGDVALGTWYVVSTRYAPGDKYPRVWSNGAEVSLVNQGETPDFPPPPLEWQDITSMGGTPHDWMWGADGDWNLGQNTWLAGPLFAGEVGAASQSPDDFLRDHYYHGLLAGIAMPAPAAPAGLAATPGPTLTWVASPAGSGVNAYNVYRGSSPGGEALYAALVAGPPWADPAPLGGVAYYEVTAVIATTAGNAESAPSNEARWAPGPVTDPARLFKGPDPSTPAGAGRTRVWSS